MSLNGVLLIHKPSGPTSHDVVHKVRKILKTKQVGHAGTLDPMASGLLVLLIGEGTKLSNYLLEGDKSYQATVRLGLSTDTLDITGAVLKECADIPSPDKVIQTVQSLAGPVELPVPIFSAVKVQGEKLYEKAHKGEKPTVIPKKIMKFWDFEGIEVEGPRVRFHVRCSKGSFIRSLAAEIGDRLGCGGTLEVLVRTGSAPFSLMDAISLEDLESWAQSGVGVEGLGKSFQSLSEALPHWPCLKISGLEEKLLIHGQVAHTLEQKLVHYYLPQIRDLGAEGVRILSRGSGQLRALLVPKEGYGFKIQRIFPPRDS